MSNLAFDFQPSVPTLDVSTLAPYDVHIAVNGQIIELTASTRPSAPGGDFLRLFYKRAFSPENMQVDNDAANSVITISVSSANIAVMHSLAEIIPITSRMVRLVGDMKEFHSIIPWKAVAFYEPNGKERNSASYFNIVPLNPYGVNDETYEYLRHLGGWKIQGSQMWRIPMNKLFKFVQSNTPGEHGVAITISLARILVAPIGKPFDGNLLSLKQTPIKTLHYARYDTRPQNSTRERGKSLAESLTDFGYGSVFDVLYNRPRRYLDLSNPVSSLRGLDAGENAYIVGRISSWEPMYSGKGSYCMVKTDDKKIKVTFWGPSQWRIRKFPVGTEVIVGGKVAFYNGIALTADFIDTLDVSTVENPYIPVYAQSPSRGIMNPLISNMVREALTRLTVGGNPGVVQGSYWGELPEGVLGVSEALVKLHFPECVEDIGVAVDSLAWHELVWMQVMLRNAAATADDAQGVVNAGSDGGVADRVVDGLPYSLTGDQVRAYETIKNLMAAEAPMDALLSADVGAGKTIVQILAALVAVDSGRQAVIIAPTDILARQIYVASQSALKSIDGMEPLFVSGSLKASERKAAVKKIEDGSASLIIGTHTLLNMAKFHDLGFVCFDEQQKFGVEQRDRLLMARADGAIPDFLVATATPIPRTIAQIAYGEVEFIKISEKPAGRKPVETEWVAYKHDEMLQHPNHRLWEDIRREIKQGHQAFIVAPLVEEANAVDAPSVKELATDIRRVLPSANIGMLHGKMKPSEQAEIMQSFRDGDIDVLVASTIVEVGVDIPNATRIVIMGAERLGASSLHQLRGRVGRNDLHAKCWLVSPAESKSAQARMNALVEFSDGFEIAEADTETRGEGDVLTQNQHGTVKSRFLSLGKHKHLIDSATATAEAILADPEKLPEAYKDALTFFEGTSGTAI